MDNIGVFVFCLITVVCTVSAMAILITFSKEFFGDQYLSTPAFMQIPCRSSDPRQRLAQIAANSSWHREDLEICYSERDQVRVAWNTERLHALSVETMEIMGVEPDGSDRAMGCCNFVFFGFSVSELEEICNE